MKFTKEEIEANRKEVEGTITLGYIGDLCELTIKEAKKEIMKMLSEYPDDAWIEDDNHSYGGGAEMVVKHKVLRKESDTEVKTRLIKERKNEEDREKSLKKAMLLLEKNGYEINQKRR